MKRLSLLVASIFIAASALGQTSENTKSAGPGASYPPIGDIHAHVCGIHFYNGDMSRQISSPNIIAHIEPTKFCNASSTIPTSQAHA